MSVSAEDRDAMARLLSIMNGQPQEISPLQESKQTAASPVELLGPGQVSSRDINAMADVLRKLENAVNSTSSNMLEESARDPELKAALNTTATSDGVKIGIYKIQQQLDESRVAGKQYYNVINQVTGHVVAHELSLYEAAHGLVKMLNNGLYFNSAPVRQLMEAEAAYTSHKIDAVRFHRAARKQQKMGHEGKSQLMETRKQDSLDKAMLAKSNVKKLSQGRGL